MPSPSLARGLRRQQAMGRLAVAPERDGAPGGGDSEAMAMAVLNCLWVGVLAGLVGSRLIRTDEGYAAPGSSVTVGLVGGLIGLTSRSRFSAMPGELPHIDILSAGIGAAVALVTWAVTQRLCVCRR